jgi:transaldolase
LAAGNSNCSEHLHEEGSMDSAPEPKLRLFLDSADPSDWEEYLPLGIFHGVTTNPLLLERAGQSCTVANLRRLTARARDLGAGEIHVQTWGSGIEAMTETAEELATLTDPGIRAMVKIPASAAGFRAAKIMVGNNIPVTLTAVYTPGQVLAAAGLGADYAAPYLGRLDDAGQDGPATIEAMKNILSGTGTATRLLVASLRSVQQVIELAVKGLDTFTFGTKVARELITSDLTSAAASDFQRAAESMSDRQ